MRSNSLGEMIQRVLREAPFAMRQLAGDAGLSYDVLRSWRSGRRRPSRSSALRLAAGLEGRGERLLELARELRVAAESRTDEGAAGEGRSGASEAGETSGRPREEPTLETQRPDEPPEEARRPGDGAWAAGGGGTAFGERTGS